MIVGKNMFDEAIAQAIEIGRARRQPNRLMYLGNVPRPYGINETDVWNLDGHLAAVMANGLRMLVAYGHCVRDEAEYERIASKLEFYATNDSALFEAIDWSNDAEDDSFLGWVNANDRSAWPGMNEYSAKSAQIEYWQRQYMFEALEWLAKYWGELWD